MSIASITSFGAAGEVTGSCHLLEMNDVRVLLDCGMFQGSFAQEQRNRRPFDFDPRTLDAVILSHAHIDHSGRLPRLSREGFRGPVHTHHATADLCAILFKDAEHLQAGDLEIENRKRARKGLKPLHPLYDMRDVERAVKQFDMHEYNEWFEVARGVSARFHDAGHILGSAIVEVKLEHNGQTRTVVFSGDLGPYDAPILRDPVTVPEADLVLLESTYGDRDHRSYAETIDQLADILTADASLRGNILIPAFAVGRSQELLYLFAKHFRDWRLHRWQIYLDSPLAIEATNIYLRHRGLYDGEAARLLGSGDPHHNLHRLLPNLRFTRTPQESQALNRLNSGAIIIAGSGMCNGGRIKHHLKHWVWRDTTQVIIIGYQAMGTPGRALVDGNDYIRLWGEAIRVKATVHTLGGLSAHAGQHDLLRWIGGFGNLPPVQLVHGETAALTALRDELQQRYPGRKLGIAEAGQPLML